MARYHRGQVTVENCIRMYPDGLSRTSPSVPQTAT